MLVGGSMKLPSFYGGHLLVIVAWVCWSTVDGGPVLVGGSKNYPPFWRPHALHSSMGV